MTASEPADPAPSLYGVIPYTIRLANSNALSSAGTLLGDVWDAATVPSSPQTLTVTPPPPTRCQRHGNSSVNFSAVAETYDRWTARNFRPIPALARRMAIGWRMVRLNLVEYAIGSDPNVAQNAGYLDVSFAAKLLLPPVRKGPAQQ